LLEVAAARARPVAARIPRGAGNQQGIPRFFGKNRPRFKHVRHEFPVQVCRPAGNFFTPSREFAGVRRETGGEYEVKVLYGEGRAHHTGPEPCAVDRGVGGEASAGGGIGQPLSRERILIPGADDVPVSEGHTDRRNSARTVWPGVVLDPGMCSSSPRGNREISCPSGALAPPDRVGKARSRSRR